MGKFSINRDSESGKDIIWGRELFQHVWKAPHPLFSLIATIEATGLCPDLKGTTVVSCTIVSDCNSQSDSLTPVIT